MKKNGITLVELLIVISVMAILLTAFSGIFGNSVKRMREELTQTQTQTEAQTVLDRIQTEIKKGRTVENTFTSGSSTYTTGPETIIIQIPAIDSYSSQNILYAGNNPRIDRVIYYKSGNTLHRKVIADSASARMNENGQDKIISTSISNLLFTYTAVNPTSSLIIDVDTSITITKKVGKVFKNSTVKGKASFRNLP